MSDPFDALVAELRKLLAELELADWPVGTPEYRLTENVRSLLADWDAEVGE